MIRTTLARATSLSAERKRRLRRTSRGSPLREPIITCELRSQSRYFGQAAWSFLSQSTVDCCVLSSRDQAIFNLVTLDLLNLRTTDVRPRSEEAVEFRGRAARAGRDREPGSVRVAGSRFVAGSYLGTHHRHSSRAGSVIQAGDVRSAVVRSSGGRLGRRRAKNRPRQAEA